VAQAAAVNHVPVTLELGGKSPQILFADADLNAALPVVVNAIIQNAGQTCSAGSRVLIERPIYADVMALLKQRFEALRTGPGPRRRARLRAADQPQASWTAWKARRFGRCDAGAPGGGARAAEWPMRRSGFYFPPLLLSDLPHHAPRWRRTRSSARCWPPLPSTARTKPRLANDTPYGLTAAVWTRDGGRALRMAHRIDAGQVFINNYGAGGGIELPFGGMKHSGYGREKAFEGLKASPRSRPSRSQHG
jgi:aldehyde dehydrogenase (NAD+)